jgi:hypothetical protein
MSFASAGVPKFELMPALSLLTRLAAHLLWTRRLEGTHIEIISMLTTLILTEFSIKAVSRGEKPT